MKTVVFQRPPTNVYLFSPSEDFSDDQLYHLKIENERITEISEGTYGGTAERVIDGKEKVLCPSFTDSHLHLLRYGLMKMDS